MGMYACVMIHLGYLDCDDDNGEVSPREQIRQWIHDWIKNLYDDVDIYPANLRDVEGAFPGVGAVQANILSFNMKWFTYDDMIELKNFLEKIVLDKDAVELFCKLEDDERFRVYVWDNDLDKMVEQVNTVIS